MRLIRDVPEVESKIEKGELSLTVASQVGSFFRQQNQKRKEQKTPPISQEEKLDLLKTLERTSSRECEKKLAEIAPEAVLPREKTRAITKERTLVQFTADQSLMSKIHKLQALLSHKNQTGSLEELFNKLADMALERLDPERREKRRQKRQAKKNMPAQQLPAPEMQEFSPPKPHNEQTLSSKKLSRYIPQALRDRIWLRDHGRCQHRDPHSGRICGSTQRVELDHRWAFALGGENTEENLQLRCRSHNQ